MNLRLRYDLPTTRADGRELLVGQIRHVVVLLSADGVNFAEVARVAPPAREYLQTDLDPGLWTFRLMVEDTLGQFSVPVDVSYTIRPVIPGPVLNPVITEE